jgi:hypothetical protein
MPAKKHKHQSNIKLRVVMIENYNLVKQMPNIKHDSFVAVQITRLRISMIRESH